MGAHFDIGNAIAVLMDPARNAAANMDVGARTTPMLTLHGGVENFNAGVDGLIVNGTLRRVLAPTEVSFSNSLIEAFRRTMNHQWLFLNKLDAVAAVRRHAGFYIAVHNSEIPHAAFRGQTPEEMYFNHGLDLPDRFAEAKKGALTARLRANREVSCANCSGRLALARPTPSRGKGATAA